LVFVETIIIIIRKNPCQAWIFPKPEVIMNIEIYEIGFLWIVIRVSFGENYNSIEWWYRDSW